MPSIDHWQTLYCAVKMRAEKFERNFISSPTGELLTSLSCSQVQFPAQAPSLSDLHINYLLLHQWAFGVLSPFPRTMWPEQTEFSRVCRRESTFKNLLLKVLSGVSQSKPQVPPTQPCQRPHITRSRRWHEKSYKN